MLVGYEFHQKLTSSKFMASSALKSFGTVFFFVPVFFMSSFSDLIWQISVQLT